MPSTANLWIADPLGVRSYEWTWPHTMAKSLAFLCTKCGITYAKLRTWKTRDSIEPFSAVHGCCHLCPGDRYYVPGSLECLSLLNWRGLPLEVVQYQLQVELTFLDSVHHPFYQENPSWNSSHLSLYPE